jgi:DNA-binding transcriptional ArsR family regulator
MSKPIIDIDDPRLVKALAHPIRVRIMGLLEQRSMSPKEMAGQLGVPIENLSYHVRQLRDFGLIRLERKRQVRGAIEHYYRAAARPRITASAWEQLPEIVKEAMTGANLGQVNDVVARAAEQGKFGRPDSYLSRRPIVVDDRGFAEVSAAITEALDRIAAIEKESAKRIRGGGADEIPAVVVAMLFDAPDPAPAGAPRRRRARRTAEVD